MTERYVLDSLQHFLCFFLSHFKILLLLQGDQETSATEDAGSQLRDLQGEIIEIYNVRSVRSVKLVKRGATSEIEEKTR